VTRPATQPGDTRMPDNNDYNQGYEEGHDDGYGEGLQGHFGSCGAIRLREMDPDYRSGYMDGYAEGNQKAENEVRAT